MSHIEEEINLITNTLPTGTRLVAVSKYHPADDIKVAYSVGQRIFGENLVQELQKKQEILPKDIQWHFIGHLQTNKVKYIAPYVSLIHAVDSIKLLREINKQGAKCDRKINVLLQLHVAAEETKFGFTPQECWDMLADGEWRNLNNVEICGIMCMASHVDDEERICADFDKAYDFFNKAKETFFTDSTAFCERSWGMSNDYKLAIEHGSTLVRIGSKIFGERVYK